MQKSLRLFLTFTLLTLIWITPGFSQPRIQLPQKGICAHRGGLDNAPENTIPAFKNAISYGVQMIEFDVHFSKDSGLVIMHDETVDRTTDGHGKISDLTLVDILNLDAGIKKGEQYKGTKVPTLEQTLAVMPKNIWLNCHVKGGGALGKAVALFIKQHNRQNQTFLTCEEDAAHAAKAAYSQILICNGENSYRNDVPKYVDATINMKAEFIQLLALKPGEDRTKSIEKLKQRNIHINYFFAQNINELDPLLKSGVDFVLVNDVVGFSKEAKKLGIKPVHPIY